VQINTALCHAWRVSGQPNGSAADERAAHVLVSSRFRVEAAASAEFATQVRAALEVLAERPGYVGGWVGQATDDAELHILTTMWTSIGAYRKALSAYDVKVSVVPFLYLAIDEPSAYEIVHARDRDGVRDAVSALALDAGDVALGEAAGAVVPPVIT